MARQVDHLSLSALDALNSLIPSSPDLLGFRVEGFGFRV